MQRRAAPGERVAVQDDGCDVVALGGGVAEELDGAEDVALAAHGVEGARPALARVGLEVGLLREGGQDVVVVLDAVLRCVAGADGRLVLRGVEDRVGDGGPGLVGGEVLVARGAGQGQGYVGGLVEQALPVVVAAAGQLEVVLDWGLAVVADLCDEGVLADFAEWGCAAACHFLCWERGRDSNWRREGLIMLSG